MQPLLIYCYDAYCGWCYGFSNTIARIATAYKNRLSFEVLSGGMVLPEAPAHISVTASYIQQVYKTVENRTGIQFGNDYLWHIDNPDKSDWFPNSEKPAIALCILKEYQPDQQIQFAADLQYSLHYEGRDLTDDEAYRHLLTKYAIPENEFYEKLKDIRYKEKAYYEFALVKQLKVSGFPTVFIQTSETKFYLAARGYTDYEQLQVTIGQILTSIN